MGRGAGAAVVLRGVPEDHLPHPPRVRWSAVADCGDVGLDRVVAGGAGPVGVRTQARLDAGDRPVGVLPPLLVRLAVAVPCPKCGLPCVSTPPPASRQRHHGDDGGRRRAACEKDFGTERMKTAWSVLGDMGGRTSFVSVNLKAPRHGWAMSHNARHGMNLQVAGWSMSRPLRRLSQFTPSHQGSSLFRQLTTCRLSPSEERGDGIDRPEYLVSSSGRRPARATRSHPWPAVGRPRVSADRIS